MVGQINMVALLTDPLPCHQYSEERVSFHRSPHGDSGAEHTEMVRKTHGENGAGHMETCGQRCTGQKEMRLKKQEVILAISDESG
jgi:hypothetical protein